MADKKPFADRFSEAMQAVSAGLKAEDLDEKQLRGLVEKACGLSADVMLAGATGKKAIEICEHVYRTFGAPGNWGYGTPLGDAMSTVLGLWTEADMEVPKEKKAT
jgi:hypothetical protein